MGFWGLGGGLSNMVWRIGFSWGAVFLGMGMALVLGC